MYFTCTSVLYMYRRVGDKCDTESAYVPSGYDSDSDASVNQALTGYNLPFLCS